MSDFSKALQNSWDELKTWVSQGKLNPENEEEVQCFLYHGLVARLEDAAYVKPKPTTAKPSKLKFRAGKLETGNMHFPDFILGVNSEVVVEIKFARTRKAPNLYAGCKTDMNKMHLHHKTSKRFFILYDMCKDHVFLDEHQLDELKKIDPDCTILLYPEQLNPSKAKAYARKAIATMRKNGVNFVELGKKNAAKGMIGNDGG